MNNSLVPTQKEINQMKQLMNILNQAPESTVYQAEYVDNGAAIGENHNFQPVATTLTNSDVKDMKSILEKFNRATSKSVETLVEEAKYDNELKEALVTQKTSKGARIGNWEIRVKIQEGSGKGRKFYDIINTNDGSKIAEGLYLYEAAYGIVKCLNKGLSPLSKNIRDIIELEEKYCQFRNDAVRFKRKAYECLKKNDGRASSIFESRYDDHKDKALTIYGKLKSIVKSL